MKIGRQGHNGPSSQQRHAVNINYNKQNQSAKDTNQDKQNQVLPKSRNSSHRDERDRNKNKEIKSNSTNKRGTNGSIDVTGRESKIPAKEFQAHN